MLEKIKRSLINKKDRNVNITLETLKQNTYVDIEEIKDYLDYLAENIPEFKVVDNLQSEDSKNALSVNQGKSLSNRINTIENKAVFSVGFDSSNFSQKPGDMNLNKIQYSNTEDIILENGEIIFKKDMKVLVSGVLWFATSLRVWAHIRTKNMSQIIDMIGQDASGYMTLSSGEKVFNMKKGESIVVNFSANSDSININSGSGNANASYITVREI